MTTIETGSTVSWLVGVPVSDGNWQANLERATIEDLEQAIAALNGQEKVKTKLHRLRNELDFQRRLRDDSSDELRQLLEILRQSPGNIDKKDRIQAELERRAAAGEASAEASAPAPLTPALELARLSPNHPLWHVVADGQRHAVCGRAPEGDGERRGPAGPIPPPGLCAQCESSVTWRVYLNQHPQPAEASTPTVEASPVSPLAPPGATQWAAMLSLREIDPAPDNPRRDLGDLDELTASIRAQGILEPLLVTPRDGRYLLVCGHRRYAAARAADLTTAPCVIRDLDEPARVAAMLIENVQRSSLAPLEEAMAYQRLLDVTGMTQRELSPLVGTSQGTISKRLELLELPDEARAAVDSQRITLREAGELHKLVRAGAADRAAKLARQHVTGELPSWRSLDDIVKEDLKQVQADQRAARARADLQAQGVTVLTEPKGGWQNRAPRPIGGQPHGACIIWTYEHLRLDLDQHRSQHCHAAAVCDQHGEIVWMCRDPKLHAADADRQRDRAEQQRREQQRAEERTKRERTSQRLDICRQILATDPPGAPLPTNQLLVDLTYTLLGEVWVQVQTLAVQLLDLQTDPALRTPSERAEAALRRAIEHDPWRGGMALVLAAGEQKFRESWWSMSPAVRRYADLLQRHGYQLDDNARAKLDRGQAADAEVSAGDVDPKDLDDNGEDDP